MLAGLEKKQGDKDHAASRTQEIRNNVKGDNVRVTENKIESDTEIYRDEEYKANESLDDLQKYEYDYEFDDDYSDDEDNDENELSEDDDKPEYYYYYYYDYLDSGIDISHELSNNVEAGYETLPTPLRQVGEEEHGDSDEKAGDEEGEDHTKYEITTDNEDTAQDENIHDSDNTGDAKNISDEECIDAVVI